MEEGLVFFCIDDGEMGDEAKGELKLADRSLFGDRGCPKGKRRGIAVIDVGLPGGAGLSGVSIGDAGRDGGNAGSC